MWHGNLSPTQQQGRLWEQRALTYLRQRGLTLVASNYTCKGGEIDLVMRDRDTLVFVEVRQRDGTGYGGAAASISPAKIRRLVRAAQTYLLRYTRLPPDWLRNAIEL